MHITRAIVTGGSGFIGSHLVDALIEAGIDVTVIDFAEPKYPNAKASYVNHDIRHAGLDEVFNNLKPEVVFHLAAQIDDRASVHDPVLNSEHNVLGSLRVFEAARKAGVKKIVATSSCAVYGATDKSPLTEKLSPQPLTPYGASKLAMEYYLDFYNQRYGIQTVALRLANIYGPRQESSLESGAVAVFTNRLLAGQQVYLNDDGQTVRDYLYVSEVVSGLMAAAQSQDSSIYNLGTKVGTTTQALYTLISGYLNSKLQPIPRPEVKDAAKVAIVKAAKAKQGLDWKSKIGLKRGLKATIKWYQDRH